MLGESSGPEQGNKGSAMRLRIGLAMVLCLGFAVSCVPFAAAGVIKAVAAKHKAKPDSLHAKLKHKKVMSDHQPLLRHKKK